MHEVRTLDCNLAYHVVYCNSYINVALVCGQFRANSLHLFLTCSLAKHAISVPMLVIVLVYYPYALNNLAHTRMHQPLLVRLVFSAQQ